MQGIDPYDEQFLCRDSDVPVPANKKKGGATVRPSSFRCKKKMNR